MSKGTTARNFRCDADLWDPAVAKAKAEGTTMTEVLKAAVKDFLMRPPPTGHPEPPT